MSGNQLKWLSVLSTVMLAAAFGWAVASSPEPDSAALHPKLAGNTQQSSGVRPGDGTAALTQTYVS